MNDAQRALLWINTRKVKPYCAQPVENYRKV